MAAECFVATAPLPLLFPRLIPKQNVCRFPRRVFSAAWISYIAQGRVDLCRFPPGPGEISAHYYSSGLTMEGLAAVLIGGCFSDCD